MCVDICRFVCLFHPLLNDAAHEGGGAPGYYYDMITSLSLSYAKVRSEYDSDVVSGEGRVGNDVRRTTTTDERTNKQIQNEQIQNKRGGG